MCIDCSDNDNQDKDKAYKTLSRASPQRPRDHSRKCYHSRDIDCDLDCDIDCDLDCDRDGDGCAVYRPCHGVQSTAAAVPRI